MYFIFAGWLTDNIKNMRLLHQDEHNPPPLPHKHHHHHYGVDEG